MTLPASPPIKASDINVELGRAAGAAFNIQGTEERGLAGVPSGAISMSDFLGKSSQGSAFISLTAIGSGSSSYSVSVGISTASANRRVVMAIHWLSGNPDVALNSASIGGVSAAIHIQAHHTGGVTGLGVAIISAIVPTGTTATLALNFSQTTNTVSAGIWWLNGYNTLVAATSAQSSTTATTIGATVNTNAGGIVIAGYQGSSGTAGAPIGWSGLTELYDNSLQGGAWLTGLSSGSLSYTVTQGTISNAGNDTVVTSWSA